MGMKSQLIFRQSIIGCGLGLTLLFLPGASAWARQELVPGSRYTSARGAAMGDAVLPIGEDGPSALFTNPANIGKIRKDQIEGMNLSFYGSSDYFGMFRLTSLDFYKIGTLHSYLPTLQANPGKVAGMGASMVSTIATRGFAAGVLLQSQVVGMVNADGTIRYRSLYQLVPTAGTGVRLAGGIVRLGYTLQWVNQAVGSLNSLPAATTPLGYNQGLYQGSALSHNFGFALTLPIRYLPSLNVVARNVLGANFNSFSLISFAKNAAGAPPREPMTVDASFSLQPKLGSGSYMNFVVEERDLTGRSGVSLFGRLAVGLETSLRDLFFVRLGWGSGYPAAGIGFRRKAGEFSLTYHTEDIGTSYHELRETKFLLQYQVRAF